MKDKSPALQWYPKQALGDDKILAMDWDAQGMHYRLLWISWQQEPPGTLPDDMAVIRRWLGSPSEETWRRVSPQIMTAWFVQGSRRVNAGMVRSWERQQRYSESRKKSADARWQHEQCESDTKQIREPCEATEDEVVVGFILPDWIPKEAWKDYTEMRRRIRKPMTKRAQELAVKELEKLKKRGHGPAEVLNQSVLHSWQGLFELRNGTSVGIGRGHLPLPEDWGKGD